MRLVIIGGGLAGVSLAYFVGQTGTFSTIEIVEKESKLGGLLRSFRARDIHYDIGPHIIFSKNKSVLNFMETLLSDNLGKIRRSNRVVHRGRLIQYPFENDLSQLPEDDLEYCVNTFLNNPFQDYTPTNMLQFFLKTFGEGITNLYLRPYNEKIWKFDPCFMDTQMVERIPAPTKEEVLRSAAGETVDGYLHQLYFSYPESGGIESLLNGFVRNFTPNVAYYTDEEALHVRKNNDMFHITTARREIEAELLVSTMPVEEFTRIYKGAPKTVVDTTDKLKFNSIAIAVINVREDRSGDNFAYMIADKEVLFHRISKLDFLGESYHMPGSVTYMAEVTYRKNDLTDQADNAVLLERILDGMIRIGFINSKNEVNFSEMRRFDHAYIIYDLNHRENMDVILDYYRGENVFLHGRFGLFEYLNMDAVIGASDNLAHQIISVMNTAGSRRTAE